jgi:hypothetical protein
MSASHWRVTVYTDGANGAEQQYFFADTSEEFAINEAIAHFHEDEPEAWGDERFPIKTEADEITTTFARVAPEPIRLHEFDSEETAGEELAARLWSDMVLVSVGYSGAETGGACYVTPEVEFVAADDDMADERAAGFWRYLGRL